MNRVESRGEAELFTPARDKDLPYLRRLIEDGAKAKSFDEELASQSPESELFFANIGEVLARNVWTRPAASGMQSHTPAHVHLYQPTAISIPIGFVATRGIGTLGYELWLTAIDRDIRGRGIGRSMLADFLATSEGRRVAVAQCRIDSPGAQACAHILSTLGFTTARVGKLCVWLARSELPSGALHWMRTAPLSPRLAS